MSFRNRRYQDSPPHAQKLYFRLSARVPDEKRARGDDRRKPNVSELKRFGLRWTRTTTAPGTRCSVRATLEKFVFSKIDGTDTTNGFVSQRIDRNFCTRIARELRQRRVERAAPNANLSSRQVLKTNIVYTVTRV